MTAGCSQRGVSLLEVLLSMTFFTVASLALLHGLALSFEVASRSRELRRDALRQWNESQQWRASRDMATRSDPAPGLQRKGLDGTASGLAPLEVVHGDR